MPLHKYKLVTNVCFAVAVIAVLVFDRFPNFHRLLGTLIAAAAVVAVYVHLYQPMSAHWRRRVTRRTARQSK